MNCHLRRRSATYSTLLVALAALLAPSSARAQITGDPTVGGQPVMIKVGAQTRRLEMIANSSRILTLPNKIPRAQVNNPDVLDLTPLSPTQIQLFAKKAGVTQVNLWDQNNQVQSIDVIVYGDSQELTMMLRSQFPTASIRVVPLKDSVVLSGFVGRPEQISRVIQIAENYYPTVINNIDVGGVQQVLLHVKVMEVSRTKLRALGFDFSVANGSNFLVSSVSGMIAKGVNGAVGASLAASADTVRFGFVDGNTQFFGFLEALRQNNMVKILAEPTLVTVSGRPASFQVGGEFPITIQQPQGIGNSLIYKTYGTQVDFVPIVLGNGRIRLEVRPRVSEIDNTRGTPGQPALTVRQVDTGVEMRAGQTLALAGLVQTRIESENRGVPYLSDIPWLGAAFRRVQETQNEIELLIMVTPELVEAMECDEVPPIGPGMNTTSPRDCDLYWRGHLEVPNRRLPPGGMGGAAHCPDCRAGGPGLRNQYEEVPPGSVPTRPTVPPQQPRAAPKAQAPATPAITRVPRSPRFHNTASQPATTRVKNRDNPYDRAIRATDLNGRGPDPDSSSPGFIGPVGYDVHQ